jgi:hypothetical protein
MSRRLGLSGLVALVCVLGCTHDQFVAQPSEAEHFQVVAAGSVSQVSGVLQDGLSEAGILVVAKRAGSSQRLAGITESGKTYCLILQPHPESPSKRTVVSAEWGGKEPNRDFWKSVTKLLAQIPEKVDSDRRSSQ